MMDSKLKAELQPVKNEMQDVRSVMQDMKKEIHQIKLFRENIVMPGLNAIEACYADIFMRYRDYTDRLDAAIRNIDLLKKVVTEHSEKLQKIS